MKKPEFGRPAVVVETGEDESFLLGTREQLMFFANEILRLLDEPTDIRDWHGIDTIHPRTFSLTDPMSEIVIDGIVIVQSEIDRRNLMNSVRVNAGDPPIYWKGHDEAAKND